MTFKVTDKYFKTIYTKEKNPTKSNIHFIIIDSWDSDSVIRLYKDAGWWKDDYSPDDIPKIIKESFRFCIGINTNTGETIATGRIISDGVSTGYIQDLCVLKQSRGIGVGSFLLQYLINIAGSAGLNQIILVAEPDTTGFYERAGLVSLERKTFFLF